MPRADRDPLRVLIVEDEALLALQIELLLLEAGHEPVGHAMDCEEAIELARETHPDLAGRSSFPFPYVTRVYRCRRR